MITVMAICLFIKTKTVRFVNFAKVFIFSLLTRRRVDVYLCGIEENIPGEAMGCIFSWLWQVKYPSRIRRANCVLGAPQAARQFAIASGVQLAEELVKATFRLPDTAAFIHLEKRDIIPLIIREKELILSRGTTFRKRKE